MAYNKKVVQLQLTRGVTTNFDYSNNNGRFAAIRGLRQDLYPALDHNTYQKYGGNNLTPYQILGGWDWWPSVGVHRTVCMFADGSLRKDTFPNCTFATTLISGYTISANRTVQFVEGGKEVAANAKKLFIFYGQTDSPRVLAGDGAAANLFSAPSADWSVGGNSPVCGAIHEGRLWAGGNANDAHRVYYSTTGNHEDFTAAGSGSISIFPGEGQKIVAMASYKGLLIVWKYPVGIYYIDTSDPTITNWKVKRVSNAVGGVSPNGWAAVDNDLVFLSGQNDLFSLSSVQQFGDVLPRSLTQLAGATDYISGNLIPLGTSQAGAAQLAYYAPKRELHITIPGGTNVNLLTDFNQEIPRFAAAEYGGTANSAIWLGLQDNLNPILLTGGSTVIRRFGKFSGLESDLVNDLFWSFSSATMNFADLDPTLGIRRKQNAFLELHFMAEVADYTVTVTFIWDGGKNAVSYSRNLVVKAATGGSTSRMYRLDIPGSGKYLQWGMTGVTGPLHLRAAFLSFDIGDERIVNF